MSSKGNGIKLSNGLTPKQNKFKNEIVKQLRKNGNINGTQAALKVYDSTSSVVAESIARENLGKPLIRKALEDELAANNLSSNQLLKNLEKVANGTPEETDKIPLKHYINVNLSLLKLITDKKQGNQGHGNNYTFINLGFSEAKKELDKMNSQASEFLGEADVVEE